MADMHHAPTQVFKWRILQDFPTDSDGVGLLSFEQTGERAQPQALPVVGWARFASVELSLLDDISNTAREVIFDGVEGRAALLRCVRGADRRGESRRIYKSVLHSLSPRLPTFVCIYQVTHLKVSI